MTTTERSELWELIVAAINARGAAAAADKEERERLYLTYQEAVDVLLAKLMSLEVKS